LGVVVVKKILNIPFIKSRGFECGQTCTAMMIKYFRPDFEPNFEEFNKIIHHKPGKYTFPMQNAIILNYYNLRSKCFSSDDYNTTKEDPDMFKRWFGDDYEKLKQFIDPEAFDFMVLEGRRINLYEKRRTSFDDIVKLFMSNYLVSFPIDWNTLIGERGGYKGHFVLLSGVKDENRVLIHDPDNGPFMEYKKVKLEKAYNHPAIADDCIVAFSKKNS